MSNDFKIQCFDRSYAAKRSIARFSTRLTFIHVPPGFEFKMLSSLDSIHISAVLEDCVDQLAILGHIMPPTLEGRPDAARIVDDELGQILQDQRDLETRYEAVRNREKHLNVK